MIMPDPVQDCGTEWAEVEVFAQVRVWLLELEDCSADSRGLGTASVVLFVLPPVVPPPPHQDHHPTHLDPLNFARFSLFQDLTVPDPTLRCVVK